MYELGTVLAGKYRIERQLGRGGMGLVLAAEHIELRTTVAVKCLHDAYAARDDVVKRFLREARASARLTSEHVCRVFDVGKLDTGVPYFVMELLEGSDLAAVLHASGPLDVATAAAYVLQACDAIQEAHAAQIIHRDLKPGNLFVTRRRDGAPLIKVLDFGVAKASDDGDFTLTSADAVVGSPAYMAPEQIRASKAADERSDIWSLGVILYELVSGKQPFRSASIGDLAIRIATEPLEPLHSVPLGFAMAVARCLEKDPADRFQRIGELAQALAMCAEPAAASVPAPMAVARSAPVPQIAAGAAPPETLATYPAPERPAPASAPGPDAQVSTTLRAASGSVSAMQPTPRPRRAFVIVGVAVILIGAGFAILLGPLSSGGGTQPQLRVRSDAPSSGAPAADTPAAPAPAASAKVAAPDPAAGAAADPARPPAAATPEPVPAAPTPVSATPAPMPATPKPVPAASAATRAMASPVQAAPIDAGVPPVTEPAPAGNHRQKPAPPRRNRTKSKEEIGESRI